MNSIAFKIKQFTLATMLDKASGALGSKSDLEILRSFKITGEGDHLRCAATDTDLTVLARASAVEVIEEGSLCVNAQKLIQITRQLSDDDVITIKRDGKHVLVSTQAVKWSLVAEDPDAYPPIPDPASAKFEMVDTKEFMRALSKVSCACSVDGMRPNLMVVDATRSLVRATDGVRFHSAEIILPFEFQLPVGAVSQLYRFLRLAVSDQIGISQVDDMLLFSVDDDVLMAAAVVTEFPDLKAILSSVTSNDRILVLDKAALLSAIARVRINADTDTNQVELLAQQERVILRASNKMDEFSEHELTCDWGYDPTKIVVNATFFVDALKAHDSPTVKLAIGASETSPVAVLGDRGTVTILRQLRL